MLQMWNLFNAKMFQKREKLRYNILSNRAFLLIVLFIFVLQILLVEFGGDIMRTTHISLVKWLIIIISTAILGLGGGVVIRKIGES